MSKKIDLFFCVLLGLGTLGHCLGTFKFAEFGSNLFVWSLSGAVAAGLLDALNILRNARPADKTVARIALVGNLAWLLIVILFGLSLGNFFDFRVLFHGIATLGLLFFSIRTLQKNH